MKNIEATIYFRMLFILSAIYIFRPSSKFWSDEKLVEVNVHPVMSKSIWKSKMPLVIWFLFIWVLRVLKLCFGFKSYLMSIYIANDFGYYNEIKDCYSITLLRMHLYCVYVRILYIKKIHVSLHRTPNLKTTK